MRPILHPEAESGGRFAKGRTVVQGGGRKSGLILAGIVLAVLKAQALGEVVHHRGAITAAAVLALVVALLQLRPLRVAAATSVLLALTLAHHSLGLGFSTAAGCFVVLLGACFATSTVLHVRQSRHDRRNRSATNG